MRLNQRENFLNVESPKGILVNMRKNGIFAQDCGSWVKSPVIRFVPIGLCGTEKLLPINQEGDMRAETFHSADVHINIGQQFGLHPRAKEQDKKEYEDLTITYIMKKIADLLPEPYRGVYK